MSDEQLAHYRDMYMPVLKVIRDHGGKARLSDICEAFLARHQHQLDRSFFTDVKDNDTKWRD